MTRRDADNESGACGRNGDRDAEALAAGVVDHGWRQAPVGDLLGGHGRF
jgi:hypothetical protein